MDAYLTKSRTIGYPDNYVQNYQTKLSIVGANSQEAKVDERHEEEDFSLAFCPESQSFVNPL